MSAYTAVLLAYAVVLTFVVVAFVATGEGRSLGRHSRGFTLDSFRVQVRGGAARHRAMA